MLRRQLLALVSACALFFGLLVFAPAAHAEVRPQLFGMHVPGIYAGDYPTVPVGAIRLWDSAVAWGQIEYAPGKFDFSKLDAAVAAANAKGVPALYVLGSAPSWSGRKHPGELPYPGASNVPSDKAWERWVRTVATRYAGRIEAYQIWNEANLATFFRGTPAQLAKMTATANRIIGKADPKAKIVAASTTLRLGKSFTTFYGAYLDRLDDRNWPVDVFAGHFYPSSRQTPATRANYIVKFKKFLRSHGAPDRPVWDTEVNYGLAGPGPTNPDRDLDGTVAAAYVSATYLDSIRLGVARSYWYAWTAPVDLLGIQMQPGTAGAVAYATTYGWLSGVKIKCSSSAGLRTCKGTQGGTPFTIMYMASGTRSVKVPTRATNACTADGLCSNPAPGAVYKVTTLPVRFNA